MKRNEFRIYLGSIDILRYKQFTIDLHEELEDFCTNDELIIGSQEYIDTIACLSYDLGKIIEIMNPQLRDYKLVNEILEKFEELIEI